MRLLVTGGAGYIGSIVAARMLAEGHEVTVLDNLSQGHEEAVPAGASFERADLLDAAATAAIVSRGSFDAVMHFAALALVSESVEHPERYWHVNVGGTRVLLDAMREAGVQRLVFSSTCAVYGIPPVLPISEQTPPQPTHPYGTTKLAVDHMIGDECAAHGLGAVSLRYFNVAGTSGALGEQHDPETHVVPMLLEAAAESAPAFRVLGTDYPTPDGTAVRDYVHVADLAEAHRLALEAARPAEHRIFNLGSGRGFSVREVLETARRVTGAPIKARDEGRRPGDPPELVAANGLIRAELGWAPERDLETMIADAWEWRQAHPGGYGGR